MLKRCLTVLVMLAAVSKGWPAGQPLEEERLINVDSAHVVGKYKWRFDFQHAWSSGETYSTRLPVADLSLYFGLLPQVHVKVEGLFNNSEVRAGNRVARSDFSGFEEEVQWRFLNQFQGAPLSAAVSGTYGLFNTRISFDNVPAVEASNKAWGLKLILQRDFSRFAQTVEWKNMRFIQRAGLRRSLRAVQLGERLKLIQARKARVDLVGDFAVLHHAGGLDFKKPWGAGVQFLFRSPHTITFFASNTSGQTEADSIWGYEDRFYAFRWSYRF